MTIKTFISFDEALELTLSSVPLLGKEVFPINDLAGRVLAKDIEAAVDSPSADSSKVDGYAVISKDLAEAAENNPLKLIISGSVTAGMISERHVSKGETVKVTTGAPVPMGADAVIREESCRRVNDEVLFQRQVHPGRNVLNRGADISQGETVAVKGQILSPPHLGLLAAAGLDNALVYRSPRVAVLATGDEIVAPGKPLSDGKLYASNMVEICGWLSIYGFSYLVELLRDDKDETKNAINRLFPEVDTFIVSGGAWGSDRDMILRVLEDLNWDGIYHKVRMSPGKPIGFGLLKNRPVFCLPGSPPSNELAFLQLALPGLMRMKGGENPLFPVVKARLGETVKGRGDWTQFIHGKIFKGDSNNLMVEPLRKESRLKAMARKEALIIIPEGREELAGGEEVDIQVLRSMALFP
ncbi:gephyrin-like molybdotransferase Glp [Thermodesulfobacteriota bacterium]